MLLIASNQVICAGLIGAFQKHIVIGIVCNCEPPGRRCYMTALLDELHELLPKAAANLKFGTGQHLAILRQDCPRNIPSSRLCSGKQQHRSLQSVWLDGSRHHNVRVDNYTEWEH